MRCVFCALILCASFSLYWETQSIFHEYEKSSYFGADSNIYAKIAEGIVDQQIAFFHPFTAFISKTWIFMTSPLMGLVDAHERFGAMFALIGALGVVAAAAAFRKLMSANRAMLCTCAYALSLSIWYFSSIHETKIIDGAIASLYIAVYLCIRQNWNIWWFLLLTSILIVGCFNSIVTAFLVLIPAVDILLREKLNLKKLDRVVLHALPAPVILVILEVMIKKSIDVTNLEAEAQNHFSLLITFAELGDHSIWTFLDFLKNWLVFSLGAPSADADHGYAIWQEADGYFAPNLFQYFSSLSSGLFFVSLTLIIVISLNAIQLRLQNREIYCLLAGLAAYSCARIVLFFIFLPSEALLYTSPVILAHLIIMSVLFFKSRFPYKTELYGFFVAMMAVSNIRFMFA